MGYCVKRDDTLSNLLAADVSNRDFGKYKEQDSFHLLMSNTPGYENAANTVKVAVEFGANLPLNFVSPIQEKTGASSKTVWS